MYEDLSKFPSGMKGLGDFIKAQETFPGSGEFMHYGLYSCRGTCQCGTGTYSAPGSHGYEAADVAWMVAQGADYRACPRFFFYKCSGRPARSRGASLTPLPRPSPPPPLPARAPQSKSTRAAVTRTTPWPSPTTPSSATR